MKCCGLCSPPVFGMRLCILGYSLPLQVSDLRVNGNKLRGKTQLRKIEQSRAVCELPAVGTGGTLWAANISLMFDVSFFSY